MSENNQPQRIDPEQVRQAADRDINTPKPGPEGMLDIKRSYEWIEQAMQQPIPTRLFGEFWIEGEISILFADTNAGKSILAVQIANSISRGEAIPGFALEAAPQPVIYFDFELSCKQFELRYSHNYTDHYVWHPNMYRAELSPADTLPQGCANFEDCIIQSIEDAVINRNVKVLVVDNLTYLRADNERASDAAPLMKELMRLKKQHGLSLLVLAHTPKRDMSRPLTLNDLQGSKMLMNFSDSSFCIGTSTKDKNLRYLKQVKVRNGAYTYTADNVALCRIDKPHNFLGYHFVDYGNERDHLRENEGITKEERDMQIRELRDEGYKQQDIADKLGIGLGTVNRALKK